jgi:hypothetical protein
LHRIARRSRRAICFDVRARGVVPYSTYANTDIARTPLRTLLDYAWICERALGAVIAQAGSQISERAL